MPILPVALSRADGVLLLEDGSVKRVIVFIDAQKFYRNACRAFFDDATGAHTHGQYRPEAVGAILASRDPDRTLTQVRLYTGRPDANLQPKAHRANVRQCQAWEAAGCFVFHRPLRYPPGWPSVVDGQRPEEKGIDVAMAVDIVRFAHDRAYDVAIVCTGDTDLIPAIEDVLGAGTGARVEVAGWKSEHYRQRLSLPGRNLWCHWLSYADYRAVEDPTDFAAD